MTISHEIEPNYRGVIQITWGNYNITIKDLKKNEDSKRIMELSIFGYL